jgi:two-component system, chemotaxis family, chemotaxis protein CheY
MDIVSVNAETKLKQAASCIRRYPEIWQGWSILRISHPQNTQDGGYAAYHSAKSIIESYLAGTEGRVYCCAETLHLVCKNLPENILREAGRQICALLEDDLQGTIGFTFFELPADAAFYADSAEKDAAIGLAPAQTGGAKKGPAKPHKSPDKGTLDRKIRALLVEDDPVTRWMVRNTLKSSCELVCAPSANKAYSIFASVDPDIVFLDINLPDNNGYSVLQWIINNDPGAYVVMFSSQNRLDNMIEALEKGARGFVPKPFLHENLMHYVDQVAS